MNIKANIKPLVSCLAHSRNSMNGSYSLTDSCEGGWTRLIKSKVEYQEVFLLYFNFPWKRELEYSGHKAGLTDFV